MGLHQTVRLHSKSGKKAKHGRKYLQIIIWIRSNNPIFMKLLQLNSRKPPDWKDNFSKGIQINDQQVCKKMLNIPRQENVNSKLQVATVKKREVVQLLWKAVERLLRNRPTMTQEPHFGYAHSHNLPPTWWRNVAGWFLSSEPASSRLEPKGAWDFPRYW